VTAFGHLLDRLGPELIRISLAFHASSSLKNTLSGVYKTGDVPYLRRPSNEDLCLLQGLPQILLRIVLND
ncbi:hypothetical protein, partial [Burkholderia cenocepacia]|uniref:hypothetical protein n=1 Tax=Burkholderia cenocepacia TaxID=95486 RepID=UPI002229BFE3